MWRAQRSQIPVSEGYIPLAKPAAGGRNDARGLREKRIVVEAFQANKGAAMFDDGEIEFLIGEGFFCNRRIGYLADVIEVAGHAVDADGSLRLGELFVQEEEFLQEVRAGARQRGLRRRVPRTERPGTLRQCRSGAGQLPRVRSWSGRLLGLGIGCGNGRNIDVHFEVSRVYPVLFQLGSQVEL